MLLRCMLLVTPDCRRLLVALLLGSYASPSSVCVCVVGVYVSTMC